MRLRSGKTNVSIYLLITAGGKALLPEGLKTLNMQPLDAVVNGRADDAFSADMGLAERSIKIPGNNVSKRTVVSGHFHCRIGPSLAKVVRGQLLMN